MDKKSKIVEDIIDKETKTPQVSAVPADNNNPTDATPAVAEAVKNPNKPAEWSDDVYNDVRGELGDEGIKKYWIDKYAYNPDADGHFLQSFLDSVHKPVPVDEKSVNRARIIAGIGDSLGLLAQMFGASRGAHIRERDASGSALSGVREEERRLRELYEKQMSTYEQGLYEAKRMDLMQGLQDLQYNRQRIYDIIANKKKWEREDAQWERAKDWAMNPNNPENVRFEKTLAENKRHRAQQNALGWASLAARQEGASGEKIDSNAVYYEALKNQDFLDSPYVPDSLKVFEKIEENDKYERNEDGSIKTELDENRNKQPVLKKPAVIGLKGDKSSIVSAYLRYTEDLDRAMKMREENAEFIKKWHEQQQSLAEDDDLGGMFSGDQ